MKIKRVTRIFQTSVSPKIIKIIKPRRSLNKSLPFTNPLLNQLNDSITPLNVQLNHSRKRWHYLILFISTWTGDSTQLSKNSTIPRLTIFKSTKSLSRTFDPRTTNTHLISVTRTESHLYHLRLSKKLYHSVRSAGVSETPELCIKP